MFSIFHAQFWFHSPLGHLVLLDLMQDFFQSELHVFGRPNELVWHIDKMFWNKNHFKVKNGQETDSKDNQTAALSKLSVLLIPKKGTNSESTLWDWLLHQTISLRGISQAHLISLPEILSSIYLWEIRTPFIFNLPIANLYCPALNDPAAHIQRWKPL